MTPGKSTQRLAVLGLGLLTALLLLELGLRVLGWAVLLRAAPPAAAPGPRPFTIVCVGDSFTYGLGAPRGQDYPSQLRALLRRRRPDLPPEVISLGVPGANSSQLLSRLLAPDALRRYHPDLVLLQAGASNWWNPTRYALIAEGRATPSLRDRLYRLRTFKLARLLLARLEQASPAPAPPAAEPLAAFQRSVERGALRRPCQLLLTHAQNREALPVDRPAEALRWLLQRAQRAPQLGSTYWGIARVLVQQRQYPEALLWLHRGLQVAPGDGVLYLMLGRLHQRWLKDEAGARRWYERGVQAAPRSALNYFALANLYVKELDAGPRAARYAEALRWLRRGGQVMPACAQAAQVMSAWLEDNLGAWSRLRPWIRADLERMLTLALRQAPRVALQTYPNNTANRPEVRRTLQIANQVAGELAREYGVPLVDHQAQLRRRLSGGDREADLFSGDREHPSARGYAAMAENLLLALQAQDLLPR